MDDAQFSYVTNIKKAKKKKKKQTKTRLWSRGLRTVGVDVCYVHFTSQVY
jgi:hypothetical protein